MPGSGDRSDAPPSLRQRTLDFCLRRYIVIDDNDDDDDMPLAPIKAVQAIQNIEPQAHASANGDTPVGLRSDTKVPSANPITTHPQSRSHTTTTQKSQKTESAAKPKRARRDRIPASKKRNHKTVSVSTAIC